jgi:23S rRNA (uracil1939-C5)-methyltransferase
MKSFSRGQRLTVHIDRLSIGGRGVARHEGLVVFVADTAPDEDVEIELTKVKKNFAEARLISVVRASPARVKPPCPVAGICGGCSWQHVSYDEQLIQKRDLVREAFRKFSSFDVTAENAVLPTLRSPKEFRYRNRIQLHQVGAKVGFFKRNSHDIVDINDCPITEEPLAKLIPSLKRQRDREKNARIELYLTPNGEVGQRLTSGATERLDHESENAEDLENLPTGAAFSQVNTEQNIHLVQYVIEALVRESGSRKPKIIYDLYAGDGNFTFPIARAFPEAKLVGVELNEESVQRAQETLKAKAEFSARDLRFVGSDVESFIEKESWADHSTVLLDPPRTGCGVFVMTALAARKPDLIVYVSCHPVTLARDVKVLADSEYELLVIQPFDMFPQTDHVETVAVFRRKA